MTGKSDKIGGKKIQGIIKKIGTDKTVKVQIEIKKADKLYGKIVKSHKGYLVHNDPEAGMGVSDVQVGDQVVIQEIKPISKTKKFILIEKVNS